MKIDSSVLQKQYVHLETNKYDFPFYIVLIFLFFEYGRPQSFLPFVRLLHPGWILHSILIILLIRYREKFYYLLPQSKLFLALIGLMTIHGPIAVNNYWAFIVWKDTILYFIVFLSIIHFVNSYSKIEKYIDTWILINLFGGIVGILNGGTIPNSAFMGDENDFSLVMNMAIPFAYFMFLETDSKKKKILYLISLSIFASASVVSLSRGGFIGLVAVLFYCWYKTPRKILSTAIAGFLVLVLMIAAPSSYWDEVKSITDENIESGTGAERWYFWQIGWDMFVSNPVIGVGQGNYPWVIEQYEDPLGGHQGRFHGSRPAHSIYFTLLPELGMVGTIIFIGMLFFSFRDLKRMQKLVKKILMISASMQVSKFTIYQLHKLEFIVFAVTGALVGYLVSGIFLSVLYYPHFWILMGLLVALSLISKNVIVNEFETENTE